MKNYAASVRAKLTEVANRENVRFQQLVMRFLHEHREFMEPITRALSMGNDV